MYATHSGSAWGGLFRQLCPRCHQGKIFRTSIFRGFPSMYERCVVCDLKFEREEGYFLEAMYVIYGIAMIMLLALTVVLCAITRWPLEKNVIGAIMIFVPLAPMVSRLSRI